MCAIHSDKRKSGISLIGDLSWGTHICQFYQTKEDLLEILVPYFRAGLENNELCVWITSKPLSAEDVKEALEKALPDFEKYREKGQMEVIPRGRWHARGGKAIVSRLDHAILSGFDGLRLAGNIFREKKDGKGPGSCGEIDAISRHNVMAVFVYRRDEFDALGLMEVVKNHRFAIVRNAGRWEVIESSEARVAQDALRRSEEKFHSLFSNMAEGFAYHRIVLDGRGKPCDYVFLEVNDSFERLTGLKGEEIFGKRVTEVLPGIEKDSADWIGKYGKVALTGKPVRFESYAEPLRRWYSISAFSPHKGYFAVTFSDITAHKKAEEALRESEERWATTLASIGDGVISTDVEGRITFMNAVAEALTGWGFAEASRRPVTEIFKVVNEDTRREVENPVTRVLLEGKIIGLANHTVLLRKDGTEVPIDDSGAPIRDRDGKTVGVVLVFRDVTERKQAEDNIRRQNKIQESITLIFQKAFTCDTEEELGRMCLAVVEGLTGSRFGFIGEIGRDGYLHGIAISDPGWELCTMYDRTGHRRPPGDFRIQGLYGRVLRDGKSLLTNDPASHPDRIGVPAGHPQLKAFLGAPFIQEGKIIGMVAVGNREGGYTREQQQDLEAVVPVIFQALLRKRAEERLRQSELKYRIVAENPHDWEFWLSPEGKFIYVSPSCKRITGREPEEFIQDPSLRHKIVFPEDLPSFDQHRQEGEREGEGEGEVIPREVQFRIVHTDGTIRWIGHVCKRVFDEEGRYWGVRGTNRDITERKEAEANQNLLTDILQIFNRGGDLQPLIGQTLRLIREVSGFEAVGLRFRQGEDCPYFESNGFSEEFLREEKFLCARGGDGAIVHDAEGRAVLECTCGLVLSGRTDPNMSCFTRGGSFWTNASNELLALPQEADPRTNPRNRCIHTGYQSVGLFPVRSGREIIGLLQLNDRRAGRFTPGMIVFYETLAQNIGLALQRAATEEALQKSEARYRSYIEVTEQLGWTTNADGEVVEDIPAWRRFTGQNEEDAKGWGWSNALHPDDFEPTARVWREAVARKSNYEVEYRIRRYDGVYRDFLARGVPVLKDNGDVLEWVGTCIDITERKRMGEELRKSRDQLEIKIQERTAELEKQSRILEGFFKSTITPLVFLDRNFNFIRVNEAYAKSCQRDISEFEGHNHFEFYPHGENEAIFRRVVETKVPYQAIAKPFRFPDHPEWGTTYWDWTLTPLLDDKGEVEFLVFSLEDVTGRKRAELALQEASLYARSLIEASIDPLVTISRDGKIMDVNRATELATGLSRDALIGSDFSDYFTEPEKAREGYERVFSKGSVSDYPLAIRHTSGRVIEVLYNATTFKNEAGEVQGVFAAARDITERKRAEEALRKAHDELQGEMARREKAEQQLRQSQKLEAIGTLTGGIAHDLNNILAPIVVNSEMALLDLPGGSRVRENLDLILKSGLRGKDLVRQMLLFSRKSEKKQEVFPLPPLIKETFKLLRSSLPATIQMKLHLETESDAVYADPSQIQQVVINLCTNAAYAMRGTTGSIDISLQAITFGSTDLPAADMQPGDYLVLSVKDTGSGMDEEVKKRIFEPFFTTKPVGEGTGLGLSVVYGIVKSHKGNITFYSEPGRGSIFRVYLPKADSGVSVPAETPRPFPKGNERILLVDDEEIIVNSVRNMLQHLGYKVTALMDSQEALKLFSADPSQFDLVITDQTMPFMTGEDLGREMMRLRPDIPVILSTGYSDLISPEKAIAMGFRGFIMKPFTVREGAELVRRVLDQDISR